MSRVYMLFAYLQKYFIIHKPVYLPKPSKFYCFPKMHKITCFPKPGSQLYFPKRDF